MLEISGNTVIINYSSYEVISQCLRKAQYLLAKGMVTSNSPPLVFGSAIHKALEVWFCASPTARRHTTPGCDDVQSAMLCNAPLPTHGNCVRCASVYAFLEASGPLSGLDSSDKRSRSNGVDILNAYFDHYLEDTGVVARDAMGPICERGFETELWAGPNLTVRLHGTIDRVMLREEQLIITDTKTAYSLGLDFEAKIKPNHQIAGYTFGARSIGINAQWFELDGLQVAKQKRDFKRISTMVRDDDIESMREAFVHAAELYYRAVTTGKFPMSAPTACAMWGVCQFHQVCEQPPSFRESILATMQGGQSS